MLTLQRYKYTGKRDCATDPSGGRPCHHQVCKTAKGNGVSYLEYDTILHYAQRINHAKKPRMKDALRKQRDLQLLKDLQANVEWKDKAIKKFRSLGKEASEALYSAASKFDKYLPPAPDLPDNAVERVGRELSKLRTDVLPPVRKEFNHVASKRLSTSPDSFHWRDPARYVEYFGPIQINHLEAAMVNSRDVLQLNGSLEYEADYRLRAFLEQFKNLIQHIPRSTRNASGFTVLDALNELKGQTKFSEINLPACHLADALKRCAAVETNAQQDMQKVSAAYGEVLGKEEELDTIAARAMATSPLSALSRRNIMSNRDQGRVHCLIYMLIDLLADASMSHSQIVDELVVHFERHIGQGSSKLPKFYKELQNVLEHSFKLKEDKNKETLITRVLEDALAQCQPSLESKKIAEENVEKDLHAKIDLAQEHFPIQFLPGMNAANCSEVLPSYINAALTERVHTVVDIWRGATEPFRAMIAVQQHQENFIDDNLVESLMADSEEGAVTLCKAGLERYFANYAPHCGPVSLARLTILLPVLSAFNPQAAKGVLLKLSRYTEVQPFARMVTLILHAYGNLIIELMHVFGRSDVEQMALSILWILVCHALLGNEEEEVGRKVENALCLVLRILGLTPESLFGKTMYDLMTNLLQFRCMTPYECVKRTVQVAQGDATSVDGQREAACVQIHREVAVSRDALMAPSSRKLSHHNDQLLQITNTSQFDSEVAARVLKYVASRISTGVGLDNKASLDVLWQAFLRAEAELGRTPGTLNDASAQPSSLNIGMHNHCNIWELSVSHEKMSGFFKGYELGLRNQRDIDCLLESARDCIIQYGGLNVSQIKKVMAFEGFPRHLMSKFRKVEKEEHQEGTSTEQQLVVNNWDYLNFIATKGELDYMDEVAYSEVSESPMADMHFEALADVVQTLGEDVKALQTAIRSEDFKTVARIAEDTWDKTEHVDIIHTKPERDTRQSASSDDDDNSSLSDLGSLDDLLNSDPKDDSEEDSPEPQQMLNEYLEVRIANEHNAINSVLPNSTKHYMDASTQTYNDLTDLDQHTNTAERHFLQNLSLEDHHLTNLFKDKIEAFEMCKIGRTNRQPSQGTVNVLADLALRGYRRTGKIDQKTAEVLRGRWRIQQRIRKIAQEKHPEKKKTKPPLINIYDPEVGLFSPTELEHLASLEHPPPGFRDGNLGAYSTSASDDDRAEVTTRGRVLADITDPDADPHVTSQRTPVRSATPHPHHHHEPDPDKTLRECDVPELQVDLPSDCEDDSSQNPSPFPLDRSRSDIPEYIFKTRASLLAMQEYFPNPASLNRLAEGHSEIETGLDKMQELVGEHLEKLHLAEVMFLLGKREPRKETGRC